MPRRPPKGWWDDVIKSLSDDPDVDDPAALAGWVWYHGLTPAQRRKAVAGESVDFSDDDLRRCVEKYLEGQPVDHVLSLVNANVTCLGDLQCPTCECVIITPLTQEGDQLAWIRAGRLDCSECGQHLRVTAEAARKANRRLDACGSASIQEVLDRLARLEEEK